VLLVTEDSDLREACGRAVRAAGYHVVTAAHSGHAVLAGLCGGTIDIVLSELSMADGSGPGLAERLRRHHPMLRAAYFANAGTPECEGVIVRPFTRDEVLDKLAALAR
jgi:DNA-binding NtrC family response regulator